MQVTNVKIRKLFDEGPLKAVCSVTLDDAIAIHDVKIIYAKEKYFLVMPGRQNADGTFRDVVHPINAEARENLEETVVKAYFEALDAIDGETETSNG